IAYVQLLSHCLLIPPILGKLVDSIGEVVEAHRQGKFKHYRIYYTIFVKTKPKTKTATYVAVFVLGFVLVVHAAHAGATAGHRRLLLRDVCDKGLGRQDH